LVRLSGSGNGSSDSDITTATYKNHAQMCNALSVAALATADDRLAASISFFQLSWWSAHTMQDLIVSRNVPHHFGALPAFNGKGSCQVL